MTLARVVDVCTVSAGTLAAKVVAYVRIIGVVAIVVSISIMVVGATTHVSTAAFAKTLLATTSVCVRRTMEGRFVSLADVGLIT